MNEVHLFFPHDKSYQKIWLWLNPKSLVPHWAIDFWPNWGRSNLKFQCQRWSFLIETKYCSITINLSILLQNGHLGKQRKFTNQNQRYLKSLSQNLGKTLGFLVKKVWLLNSRLPSPKNPLPPEWTVNIPNLGGLEWLGRFFSVSNQNLRENWARQNMAENGRNGWFIYLSIYLSIYMAWFYFTLGCSPNQ